jgi:hypothetical protein
VAWIWIYRAKYDADGTPRCGGCNQVVDLTADRYCPACAWLIAERVDDSDGSVYDQAKKPFTGPPADNTGRPFDDDDQDDDEDEDQDEDEDRVLAGSGRSFGQAGRTAFLDSHPVRPFSRYLGGGEDGLTLSEEISRAEELVAVAEEAWTEASRDLRETSYHSRHRHLAERSGSLTPAERSEYVAGMEALSHWRRTEEDYERARRGLDALLARWDSFPSIAAHERSSESWRGRHLGDRDG